MQVLHKKRAEKNYKEIKAFLNLRHVVEIAGLEVSKRMKGRKHQKKK